MKEYELKTTITDIIEKLNGKLKNKIVNLEIMNNYVVNEFENNCLICFDDMSEIGKEYWGYDNYSWVYTCNGNDGIIVYYELVKEGETIEETEVRIVKINEF